MGLPLSGDAGAERPATGDRRDRAQNRPDRLHLLKYGEAYAAESAEAYEQQRQERELRHLTRRAQKLGYTLIIVEPNQPDGAIEPVPG